MAMQKRAAAGMHPCLTEMTSGSVRTVSAQHGNVHLQSGGERLHVSVAAEWQEHRYYVD